MQPDFVPAQEELCFDSAQAVSEDVLVAWLDQWVDGQGGTELVPTPFVLTAVTGYACVPGNAAQLMQVTAMANFYETTWVPNAEGFEGVVLLARGRGLRHNDIFKGLREGIAGQSTAKKGWFW